MSAWNTQREYYSNEGNNHRVIISGCFRNSPTTDNLGNLRNGEVVYFSMYIKLAKKTFFSSKDSSKSKYDALFKQFDV
jgi:hypothetical protein